MENQGIFIQSGKKSGFYTGFGKFWKLIMPFSRTWKVLEKGDFKVVMVKFWIFV